MIFSCEVYDEEGFATDAEGRGAELGHGSPAGRSAGLPDVGGRWLVSS